MSRDLCRCPFPTFPWPILRKTDPERWVRFWLSQMTFPHRLDQTWVRLQNYFFAEAPLVAEFANHRTVPPVGSRAAPTSDVGVNCASSTLSCRPSCLRGSILVPFNALLSSPIVPAILPHPPPRVEHELSPRDTAIYPTTPSAFPTVAAVYDRRSFCRSPPPAPDPSHSSHRSYPASRPPGCHAELVEASLSFPPSSTPTTSTGRTSTSTATSTPSLTSPNNGGVTFTDNHWQKVHDQAIKDRDAARQAAEKERLNKFKQDF